MNTIRNHPRTSHKQTDTHHPQRKLSASFQAHNPKSHSKSHLTANPKRQTAPSPAPKIRPERPRPQPSQRRSLSETSNKLLSIDFKVYLQHLGGVMSQKKEKLLHYIKIFNLMQTHNTQIRCLQHNNTLTIYCQTQRKSLCANCVYKAPKHRTHKLLPLKEAIAEITQDNSQLMTRIHNDIKVMDDSIKVSQDNTIVLEKQLKRKLKEAETNYHRQADQLKKKYEGSKDRIQKTFDELIDKSKAIQMGVEEFKMKVWEILSKIGIGKKMDNSSSSGDTSEVEVSKQVICTYLATISHISIRDIKTKQLDKIAYRIEKS